MLPESCPDIDIENCWMICGVACKELESCCRITRVPFRKCRRRGGECFDSRHRPKVRLKNLWGSQSGNKKIIEERKGESFEFVKNIFPILKGRLSLLMVIEIIRTPSGGKKVFGVKLTVLFIAILKDIMALPYLEALNEFLEL